jgi:hypothetical protein
MADRPITEMDKITRKLHNKYIGIEPMMLIGIIALIIIYYFVFSSLGNNEDGKASTFKVFIETTLWLLFILLLLLNGVSYIFGIDLIQTLNASFISNHPDIDDPYEEDIDINLNVVLKEQVFNLPENKYTYDDAKAVCKAYGSRLANYDEMSKAYDKGADWCSYGWSDQQMALFPTQKEKWEKLQKIKGHEQDCGRPGINGGYIYDPKMTYGVNCFGYKPNIDKSEAERMREKPFYNKTVDEMKFDERVNHWRGKLNEIEMAPFNHDSWSML